MEEILEENLYCFPRNSGVPCQATADHALLIGRKEHDHALSLWVKAREIARLHKNHNLANAGGALAKCREPAFLGPGRYVGARQ